MNPAILGARGGPGLPGDALTCVPLVRSSGRLRPSGRCTYLSWRFAEKSLAYARISGPHRATDQAMQTQRNHKPTHPNTLAHKHLNHIYIFMHKHRNA